MTDTIFALSSGAPPAAIAVIRVSGPGARQALTALAGNLPQPRTASLRTLRVSRETELDRALVLWFPGPATATGEDLVELHLHGGRAVVAAVETALTGLGLRRAAPGEFTRRAFVNGRIDLAEAEGLADLLSAETELQRRAAMAMAGGGLSRQVEAWRDRLLGSAALVEAALDFSDEDDVGGLPASFAQGLETLRSELGAWLARPSAEALKEGVRVVMGGPPNAGKSTLFNALVEDEAAITSATPGTTRDVLGRPVAIAGVPFLFLDTAGLRDRTGDEIEAIGIDRARAEFARADLVLWLGPEGELAGGADPLALEAGLPVWEIESRIDRADAIRKVAPRHRVSAVTGEGLDALRDDLVATARTLLPRPGDVALGRRQRDLVDAACSALGDALAEARAEARGRGDLLLVAEGLRSCRLAFDALVGRATTEDMLDALFGRFCIGK